MRGAPRPVTWWRLGPQDLPIFRKKPDTSTFVMSEDGSRTIEVVRPHRVLVALIDFTGPPYDFLLDKMDDLVARMPGTVRIYGVIRPYDRATGGWDVNVYGVVPPHDRGASYGLCFSSEELIPTFQDARSNIGLVYEIPPSECQQYALPVWEDHDPPYTGPRPSRFEREWVL